MKKNAVPNLKSLTVNCSCFQFDENLIWLMECNKLFNHEHAKDAFLSMLVR